MNLSGEELNEATVSVLSNGLNFAPAPKFIPVKEIVSGVEQAINVLSREDSEEIRREVCRSLNRAVPPKHNISKTERLALKSLRENSDIVVLPADKGNASVVLSSEEYRSKISELLSDSSYRPISRDPTGKIERKTVSLLNSSELSSDIIKKVKPHSSVPPRLYGLPKIHKVNVPLRPIVNSIGSPTYALAKYLTGLLQPLVGKCSHHVKNSFQFIEILDNIKVNSTDILVSFDVESLFTKVPLKETLELLSSHFDAKIINLFRHVLTSTYFLFDGNYYEQSDGVAMGSPISPAVANFYMQEFEHMALERSQLQPSHFFRYVDDTFIVWPHGEDSLSTFHDCLNSIHPNIKFTIEVEKNGCLPFLDILIYKTAHGTLGHRVYRKPTHTDLYLNKNSHHHPLQKSTVLRTLLHRAIMVSDSDSLPDEISHLCTTFKQNNYSNRDINKALRKINSNKSNDQPKKDYKGRAFIPYVGTVSSKIGRLLSKYDIKAVFRPPAKISQLLRPVKDDLGLRTPGIYKIPCECGKVYIGQTGRTVQDRIKEHQRCIKLADFDKSAVAEHSLLTGHRILFSSTTVVDKATNYYDRIIKEAIHIKINDTFNKDVGLQLSNAWLPVISSISSDKTNTHSSRQSESAC